MAFVKRCFVLLTTICSAWLIEGADDFYSAATLKKIAEFDDFINDTINPCDDFQQYVCSRAKIGFAEEINAQNNELLKPRILSGKKENDIEAVKKFFDFYGQCKAAFANRNESIQNMVDDLDTVFKNGTDTYQTFDATMIANLSAYLKTYHGYAFLIDSDFQVFKSARFPERKIVLAIDEPKLSQKRDMYDPKNISSNADIIRKGLSEAYAILEPNKTEAEVNATVSKLFDFEVEISKLFTFNQTDPEAGALELTVGEAMEQFPGTDWRTYVTLLSSYSDFDLLNGTELDDYPLRFLNPDLLKALPLVLENTPDEVIREYIRVRLVNEVSALSLITDPEGDCLLLVKEGFSLVTQHLYILARLPTDADRAQLKSSVTKLTNNIFAQVKNMMEKISWMRNDTETYAGFTDKMDKMTKIMAYSDNLLNETWINYNYKDISITKNDTLYKLYTVLKKVEARNQLQINLEAVSTATEPNAVYIPFMNKFFIKLGILNDIFFNQDYIPVLNYGGLGSVIGHEIIHAFDTTGIDYDATGAKHVWMSNKSRESFDEMAKCIIDEYNNFTLTDSNGIVWHVNGTITSGEDVADNAGIRAAYNAFKSDPINVQPFPRTKTLKDFTQEQLFFVAYSRVWCSPPLVDKNFAETFEDEHPPDQLRIFGTLQNFAPFREAFNCPAGSKYAPKKYCNVYAPS